MQTIAAVADHHRQAKSPDVWSASIVSENISVQKGDVLFEVGPSRFNRLNQANAAVEMPLNVNPRSGAYTPGPDPGAEIAEDDACFFLPGSASTAESADRQRAVGRQTFRWNDAGHSGTERQHQGLIAANRPLARAQAGTCQSASMVPI